MPVLGDHIFQSTLPRRERPSLEILSGRHRYFNPRSREGSDHVIGFLDKLMRISIHAPAKGATWRISQQLPIIQFQSTLPRRERRDPDMPVLGDHIFQSTLPRRERPSLEILSGRHRYFNPRSREGSDHVIGFLDKLMRISIHAPAKGATWRISQQLPIIQFQSTLPRRERRQSGCR